MARAAPLILGALGSAWALGTERAAWPALPVEQPVVTPRGWLRADGSVGLEGAAPRADVRYGLGARTEAFLLADPAAARVGARFALARSEVPGASLALEAAAEAGLAAEIGLRGHLRAGPVRVAAAALPRWDAAGPGLRAEAAALVQLGPLAPGVEARAALGGDGAAAGAWGWAVQLNLTRGVAPWIGALDGLRAGVRVAL